MGELLDEFASLRVSNLDTLRAWSLTDQQFSLTGEPPAFGTVTRRLPADPRPALILPAGQRADR